MTIKTKKGAKYIQLVDPPGGWKYGFPKELKGDQDYEKLLRDSGYPEKDIPLALKYSRYMTEAVIDEE